MPERGASASREAFDWPLVVICFVLLAGIAVLRAWLTAKSTPLLDDTDAATALTTLTARPTPAVVPNSAWTSGTGSGTPLADFGAAPSGQALAAGACQGFRTTVRGAVTTLVIQSTASSLTTGQAVIIYCYAISPSTGLPTGTPLWSETVVIGTSVAAFDTTVSRTIEANQFVCVLNPSSNAGSVTLYAANPARGGFGAQMVQANRNSLGTSSQGATMGDVSSYTLGTSSGSSRWTAASSCPVILGR